MFVRLISRAMARLPSQCRVCHAWPAQPVCEACIAQFAQPRSRCRTCAMPLPAGLDRCGDCIQQAPPLDRCLAALDYAYPWAGLIQDYKFRDHPGLVRTFATLLRATPWVEPMLEQASVLLPIPLSAQRLRERGYNQALLLARALDDGKTRADWLLRIQDTPAQHSLKRAQRLHALDHAFAFEPRFLDQLQGRRVVVVDDVMTTGASLHAAARVLRAAGAGSVSALVIARTE